MSKQPTIKHRRNSHGFLWHAIGVALFAYALAGCGDDYPSSAPRARTAYAAPHRLYFASSSEPLPATDAPPPTPDALETPDPLLQGADASVPLHADVPLTPTTDSAPDAPPKYDDPLAQEPDALAGRAPGRAMPTEHSHWLKGRVFNARVTVRLNGLLLGTYSAPQDRDITMKLRSGINTITFAYQPLSATASAQLDVLESEHAPPIPPLTTFRSPPLDGSTAKSLPTTTQTLTFLAR